MAGTLTRWHHADTGWVRYGHAYKYGYGHGLWIYPDMALVAGGQYKGPDYVITSRVLTNTSLGPSYTDPV